MSAVGAWSEEKFPAQSIPERARLHGPADYRNFCRGPCGLQSNTAMLRLQETKTTAEWCRAASSPPIPHGSGGNSNLSRTSFLEKISLLPKDVAPQPSSTALRIRGMRQSLLCEPDCGRSREQHCGLE